MFALAKLNHFLNLIEDGAWHSLRELSKHAKIPKQKLETVSKLLSETSIVEYEPKKSQVRIDQKWQRMLKNAGEEQNCEKVAVGTIVIPSKKRVSIQGIQLTNLTEKELEVCMRINKELEELAISIIE